MSEQIVRLLDSVIGEVMGADAAERPARREELTRKYAQLLIEAMTPPRNPTELPEAA